MQKIGVRSMVRRESGSTSTTVDSSEAPDTAHAEI